MATTTTATTTAQDIASRAADAGYRARVWVGDRTGETRIYLARRLSRGWQDIGYLRVTDDGVQPYLTHRVAGTLRDLGL